MELNKHFTLQDQRHFAEVTGDLNPIHIDSLAARRTQAGAPIVHGIHILLWMIDALAGASSALPPIAFMKVRFTKMLYVDETLGVRFTQNEKGFKADASVEGVRIATAKCEFGGRKADSSIIDQGLSIYDQTTPLDLNIDAIAGMRGILLPPDTTAIGKMFPHATRYLGKNEIAALGRSSYLVGMVVPGLHSLYHALSVTFIEGDEKRPMRFEVISTDRRFQLVNLRLQGSGICATLETFVRPTPIRQASAEEIAVSVKKDEFSGVTALIIGGSRGLGSLTAKIIAAGGGRVIITYARGKKDADDVAAEILARSGRCHVMSYDVLDNSEKQIANLDEKPTHFFYFATPPLLQGPSAKNQPNVYNRFYTTGFQNLVQALLAKFQSPLRAFYPSTIAIEAAPAGMEEYARSKAAGERLCTELMRADARLRIVVERLPRILTDLTASIHQIETADARDVMLPLIRKLCCQEL